jgi:hypothetical protein
LFFKITSENKIPVDMVTIQVRKNRQMEGKNPALAVATGRPSIPAPTEVPTIMKTAVTNFKSKNLVKIAFCMGRSVVISPLFLHRKS